MKNSSRRRLLTVLLVGLIANSAYSAAQTAHNELNNDYQGFQKWILDYGVSTGNTPDPEYEKASRDLDSALKTRDKKAVAALLNDNFQWVTADGQQHNKTQALDNLDLLARNNEGNKDMRTTDFRGSVERILGLHHDNRFVHVWAKGVAGWQAFAYLDIPIPTARHVDVDPPPPPKDPQADCINPCKTVGDFKPADPAQAEVLRVWLELKNSEWHPNPELWSAHADAYHETISPNGDVPMLQHVAELANALRLYGENSGNPGEPVLQMKMFTFGNVVVQQNLQGRGARPTTWIMRLFVNRGDDTHPDWKIALSCQVRITSHADALSDLR